MQSYLYVLCVCVCVQWKRLLPQLFALDQGLEDLEEHQPGRHNYNLAVYHNSDKYCAVESRKALYKFRHAVRLTHLEYQSNPDLCQVTLLNAPKMVSQSVMGREVFYHHQRGSPGDVFNTTALVTRTARNTPHQPLSGDTPAHFL
ncbi:hypothetical protein GBAR_LOCUS24413 [Geodia barretti]|uniref:Uncharacterized protein n=1 Tax=Geodia barretti TaxID=519541 RepID=A0AA35T9Y8_GEOBA|nr:hypothetical protein GBAR_LOCUS24413 [Geodia barretti]